MIKPSIGRKVWYWPGPNLHSASGSIHVRDRQQALDATVVYVHHDRCVNLHVIDHDGFIHTVHSAQLLQPEDPAPNPADPYAAWMPFQVGQAKGDQPGAQK